MQLEESTSTHGGWGEYADGTQRDKAPQATRGMQKHAWGSGHEKDRLDRGRTKLTNSCLSLLLTLCAIRHFFCCRGGTAKMPALPVGCCFGS